MTPAGALTPEGVHERLAAQFEGLSYLPDAPGVVASTLVPPDRLLAVCEMLRDDPALAFDFPGNIFGIDYLDYFEMVYQLRSFTHWHDVTIKCRVDREDGVLPSVTGVWPGADFQEREAFDMYGLQFEGHPNLSRILLWDEFEGYPLRKDFGIPAPMPAEVELGMSISTDQAAYETEIVPNDESVGSL